jgi:hypothetical protein
VSSADWDWLQLGGVLGGRLAERERLPARCRRSSDALAAARLRHAQWGGPEDEARPACYTLYTRVCLSTILLLHRLLQYCFAMEYILRVGMCWHSRGEKVLSHDSFTTKTLISLLPILRGRPTSSHAPRFPFHILHFTWQTSCEHAAANSGQMRQDTMMFAPWGSQG